MKKSNTILRHQMGFTLVEIMVTLVIMAIAAALVSPAIMQMAPNMALKSTAQGLYSDLQQAKITAIKLNRDVTVQIDAEKYYIDLDSDGNIDTGEDTNYNGILDAGEDKDGDGNLDLSEDLNGNNSFDAGEDIDADGNFDNTREKWVFCFDEDANGNGTMDVGEDQNGNGRLDTNYGVKLGTGNATKNWDDAACTQAASIQFNSRGFVDLPPGTLSQSVYIQNKNADISYAITAKYSGEIKGRKYDGTTPFNKDHWVQ